MNLFRYTTSRIFSISLIILCLNATKALPSYNFDLNNDCKINFADFAIFAEDWLGEPQLSQGYDGLVVTETEHCSSKADGTETIGGYAWVHQTSGGSVGDGYMQALPNNNIDLSERFIVNSPRLSYSIDFNTAGTYYLWVKGMASDTLSNNIYFGLDGQIPNGDQNDIAEVAQDNDFTWLSDSNDGSRPTIFIPSTGMHTLDIWMNEDGLKLDRLLLTFDVNYIPVDPPESIDFSMLNSDFSGDGSINLFDFTLIANSWETNWYETVSPVLITEFMASNETTLADDDGNFPDWIEIYNDSDTTIDVNGWYLTNDIYDLAKWEFPSVQIADDSFLVVYASGEDRSNPANPLHTNFKLDKEGEYLALVRPDMTIAYEYADYEYANNEFGYPQQYADMSYGIVFERCTPVYFGTPTPGTYNTGSIGNPPQFSVNSCIFSNNFNLELYSDSTSAVIRYTLDGSEPSETSPVYSAPIPMATSIMVKAAVYDVELERSRTATGEYVKLNSDVQNFNSNLPLVVVDTFGNTIDENNQTLCFSSFIDINDSNRATLTDKADFTGIAGIKLRGQSSTSFPKKQYSFETWNEDQTNKDVSILGFPKESDWVIHNPYSDKTLMRNVIAFQWSNDIGMYAVRTRFVEVFLNTGPGDVSLADYVGVYVFMEKIKRDKERVDITKLEPTDDTEPNITGGYLLLRDKLDGDGSDVYFSSGAEGRLIYRDPKGTEITQAQKDWLSNYFSSYSSTLYSGNYDPVTGYPKYIDVDSYIDYHIMAMMPKENDAFWGSCYFHKDRNGKLNIGPLWDYNLSFGNDYGNEAWNPEGWYLFHHYTYNYLFNDLEFRQRYIDRWFSFRENVFSTDKMLADIDKHVALLNEAQARNFVRWPLLGIYVWPNPDGWDLRDTYQKEIDWMKDWLQARLEWFDAQYFPPPIFNQDGGLIDPAFELTMAVPPRLERVVLIPTGATWSYLDNGTDQGTAWRDGSISWASGPAELGYGEGDEATVVSYGPSYGNKYITTYFRHTFNASNVAQLTSLTLNLKRDDGAVVYLNGQEIARDNMPGTPGQNDITYTTTATGPASGENDFHEFSIDPNLLSEGTNIIAVEIHQSSATSSDISFDLELFSITTNLIFEGAIWYTTNGSDPRLRGGSIDTANAVEYTVPISFTETTQVKARVLDGNDWSALKEAIFAIGLVAENLRITEIMYHPQDPPAGDPNTEFIELKNIGTGTINLKLARFTNGIDFTFPHLELDGGEYAVIVKDTTAFMSQYPGVTVDGEYTGSLENAGERIRLEDAAGQKILDFKYKDSWYDITDGEGFSLTIRDPNHPDPNSWDEKSSWRPSAGITGSPGADDISQIPALGSIVINELLAHSDAVGGDWIELHNTSNDLINIGGWYLSDNDNGDPNRMKYQIADGTSIAPGGYIVFYQDGSFGDPCDPGSNSPFALSENGETLYLQSGLNGVLTGYVKQEKFGPSEREVSFGRYRKSTGTYNFVAMSANRPGGNNAYPKVGPIVINEIMYNPQSGNQNEEYVELYNISGLPVTLYDSNENESWRIEEGIEYTFPQSITIEASGYLMVVKDVAAFTAQYGTMPAGVQVLGPYDKQLSNGGEKVDLEKPGDEELSIRYYIRVDRVNYSDGSHHVDFGGLDPWPTEPDGGGMSLIRTNAADYGNDVINWHAGTPTPGY